MRHSASTPARKDFREGPSLRECLPCSDLHRERRVRLVGRGRVPPPARHVIVTRESSARAGVDQDRADSTWPRRSLPATSTQSIATY
jgi:hypothetical protein